MTELTRALARSFRAVLRRSLLEQGPRRSWPLLLCRAGDGGLTLQAVQSETALRFHRPGPRPTDLMSFRADVLAAFEGRTDDPVRLEQVAAGKGRARWDDGGVPRSLEFDTVAPDTVPEFPGPPAEWAPMPPGFLTALDEAARTAAKESVRYALSRIQLRGQKGEVVATDGSQLLVQGGFPLPWKEDLLVPRASAFGSREFACEQEIRVGRAPNHVAVSAGPWTLLLAVDATGRYPDVQAVVPRTVRVASRLVLDDGDAALLASALPKLPGGDDGNAPVTLDLGQPPAVRTRADGGEQVTEVLLARSTVSGPPLRLCTGRRYLHRAVTLGFRELEAVTADAPLVCRQDKRMYLWVPLDKKAVIPPAADVLRVGPGDATAPATPTREKEKHPMPPPPPPTNGHTPDEGRGRDPQPERWGIEEVIAETEALRSVLQDASARTGRLLAALKNQRRHSRAVRAAMASLQQLKLDQ